MKKTLHFVYGVTAYLIFFGTFLYLIGFVGGVPVLKSVNSGAAGVIWPAILINLSFILLFGVQHTIMARQSFKDKWTQTVPKSIERSTFVLITSGILITMFLFWQPLPQVLWNIENETARWALYGISATGWALVLLSTFLINHFDLFGLRQVWLPMVGKPYTPLQFKKVGPYKWIRHPLMLGFLVAFWFTPTMTLGHLVLAGAFTSYILIGLHFEERELVQIHGQDYIQYQQTTSKLFPLPKAKGQAQTVPAAEAL